MIWHTITVIHVCAFQKEVVKNIREHSSSLAILHYGFKSTIHALTFNAPLVILPLVVAPP